MPDAHVTSPKTNRRPIPSRPDPYLSKAKSKFSYASNLSFHFAHHFTSASATYAFFSPTSSAEGSEMAR